MTARRRYGRPRALPVTPSNVPPARTCPAARRRRRAARIVAVAVPGDRDRLACRSPVIVACLTGVAGARSPCGPDLAEPDVTVQISAVPDRVQPCTASCRGCVNVADQLRPSGREGRPSLSVDERRSVSSARVARDEAVGGRWSPAASVGGDVLSCADGDLPTAAGEHGTNDHDNEHQHAEHDSAPNPVDPRLVRGRPDATRCSRSLIVRASTATTRRVRRGRLTERSWLRQRSPPPSPPGMPSTPATCRGAPPA